MFSECSSLSNIKGLEKLNVSNGNKFYDLYGQSLLENWEKSDERISGGYSSESDYKGNSKYYKQIWGMKI